MIRNTIRALLGATLFALLPVAMQAQSQLQQGNALQNAPEVTSHSHPDIAAQVRNATLGTVPEGFAELKLAPGFLLGLNVLEDPDFVGTFRVDANGEIELPYIGSLSVGGETVAAARQQVRNKLVSDGILKNPQVELNILEYTVPEVTVAGEVNSPGKFPMLSPQKLVDVLALAGGPNLYASDEIEIISATTGTSTFIHYSRGSSVSKLAKPFIVHPGDTVKVERAGIVYVLGAVNRPGGYVLQEDGSLNVLQAVALASGTTVAASTRKAYIFHRTQDGRLIEFEVSLKKILQGRDPNMQLRAKDILYIPTSNLKEMLTSSTILASVASAGVYAAAIYH